MVTSTSRIWIDAPRDAVWAVLTEAAHVKAWQYGSNLRTDWGIGSPIRFVNEWNGQTFEQWGTVLSFDPPTRLSYTLFAPRPDLEDRPENYFTMLYELVDADDGTDLAIVQDDPRPGASADNDEQNDEANPILMALKSRAEELGHRR